MGYNLKFDELFRVEQCKVHCKSQEPICLEVLNDRIGQKITQAVFCFVNFHHVTGTFAFEWHYTSCPKEYLPTNKKAFEVKIEQAFIERYERAAERHRQSLIDQVLQGRRSDIEKVLLSLQEKLNKK